MTEKQVETLSGVVDEIIFQNEDTGFTVMLLDDGSEMQNVVGELPGVAVGEELKLTGYFTTHPSYGRQFKASLFERKLPATSSSILKYLSSGAIKGVGPAIAKRLVQAFGDDTLEIMENHPERLTEVKGITAKKADEIRQEFGRMFGIRVVMMFLSKYEIEASKCIRIWKTWGISAPQVIQANPYALCTEGIGIQFQTADKIAFQLGVKPTDARRMKAGIAFVLRHNTSNGHTCLPQSTVVQIAAGLLDLEESLVEGALDGIEEDQDVIAEETGGRRFYYLPHMYQAETYVAGRIAMMSALNPPSGLDVSDQIRQLEKERKVEYAELQRQAISEALSNNLFILTGGPGTGKTTTVNAMIELFRQQGAAVTLAAPTGRAAKRLSDVTGYEAKTIHRLLEVDFEEQGAGGGIHKFKRNEKNPIKSDVIIVDEMSMVDIVLFENLMKALKLNAKLIMVGDSDQLPSVGAGNVLKDLIDSGKIKTVRLTEIFRQAAQSLIVTNAHAIVQGKMPDLAKKNNDFFFLKSPSYGHTAKLVADLCKTRLPQTYGYSPLWDMQVLSPNRIGEIGSIGLNKILQEALNPKSKEKREFAHSPYVFREGDKVMQIKNNYDLQWTRDDGEGGAGVYNGDIGIIEFIDKPSHVFVVKYEDKSVTYSLDNADELELAYAVTVHKSQGCEFEAVILPLMRNHPKLYHRNLFYTAVTRAKKLLIIIGQEESIYYMVHNNQKNRRYTNLAAFIREAADL